MDHRVLFGGIMAFMALSANGMAVYNEENTYANISSLNNFGNEFSKVLAKEQTGNYVSSPVSINVILSMAACGAEGNTKSELLQSLHLPADEAVIKDRYRTLINLFKNIQDAEVLVANKIFTSSNFDVKDSFKETTKQYYQSESQSLDFSKAEQSASTINNWAAANTKDRIKELVKPAHVQSASIVLANAVYFKGNWYHPFAPYMTRSLPFHVSETTTKYVDTMSNTANYNWGPISNLNAKYIELPYESENVSMFIVLPDNVNGLANIEENYHQINYDELSNGPQREVKLTIPKFSFETEFELKGTLQKLNIKDIFENTANFHGINDDAALRVGAVVQKTFIAVNEEGTEAAAASAIGMVGSSLQQSEPPTFTVDRPFIAVIVAKLPKAIQLFNARIVDPTA